MPLPSPVTAPRPFVIEEYVRWSDVDFAGIIFYGSYVRLFEIAETEMFRHCGLPAGLIASLAPHTLSPESARKSLGVPLSPR